MTRQIIATGHWPPGEPLRIVHMGGYELAVLDGEDVGELVAAAEAVRTEKEDRPLLGEVDSEEDYNDGKTDSYPTQL